MQLPPELTKGEKITAAKLRYWASRKLPRPLCKVCGKLVQRPEHKYCSKACQFADISSWIKGPPKLPRNICPTCGKEVPSPKLQHCSQVCWMADPRYKELQKAHLPVLLECQKLAAQPKLRKQAADKMRGRRQTALLTAEGPNHVTARQFCLRSPDGVIYKGKNIRDFVRTHSDLFDPEDVIWKASPRKKLSKILKVARAPEKHCRASKGLANLFGESANVRYSWKGWTIKL